MTQPTGQGAAVGTGFEPIWQVPDAQVASGRIPGYVGAVRIGGRVEVRAGGRMALGADSPVMREDTLFRIASVTKPVGGALAVSLIRDGVLTLDDPVARWLPEAAAPRVLVAPGAPLDQTTEAQRPVTVRHLLTLTAGWGAVLEESPLQAAMLERGVYPGPLTPEMSADEFVARVTGLPLAFQPGEGWLYDTGMDLLGVLLARAAGQPLSRLLAERITGPLGLASTSFGTRGEVSRRSPQTERRRRPRWRASRPVRAAASPGGTASARTRRTGATGSCGGPGGPSLSET